MKSGEHSKSNTQDVLPIKHLIFLHAITKILSLTRMHTQLLFSVQCVLHGDGTYSSSHYS